MDWRLWLLTVGGLGHLRPAPGSWGSIPPVALAAALIGQGLGPGTHPAIYHAAIGGVLVVFSLACVMFGDRAEARFWRKDPWQVVADETAGQCFPLMLLPHAAVATPGLAALTLVYAFVAFRAMDVIKPLGSDRLQRLPGGWGILMDDLLAGVYAMVIVQVVVRVAV